MPFKNLSKNINAGAQEVQDVYTTPPPALSAADGSAEWPATSGFFSPMQVEVITFSEMEEHIPDAEIRKTLTAINTLMKKEGPKYHIAIYVGTAVLLVVGGVVVGAISAAVAATYFLYKRKTTYRALEAFLREENRKPVYQNAGARWTLSRRGVELVFSGWEIVDTLPALPSVDAKMASTKPEPATIPPPQQQPPVSASQLYPACPSVQSPVPPPQPGYQPHAAPNAHVNTYPYVSQQYPASQQHPASQQYPAMPLPPAPQRAANEVAFDNMTEEEQLRAALLRSETEK